MLARARSALAWLLVGLGFALLAFTGFAYASAGARGADLTVQVRRVLDAPPHVRRHVPGRDLIVSVPRLGRALGILRIPELGLRTAFLEGVADRVLMQAPGHVPGTALPGTAGTSVLAAHRDMHFRDLGTLAVGDRISVRSPAGATAYRVTGARVTGGDARWITAPARGTLLRLVTCWPPSFVGPAPDRLVVEAAPTRSAGPRGVPPPAAWRGSTATAEVPSAAMPVGDGPALPLTPFLGALGAALAGLALFGRWRSPHRARGWFGLWVVGACALNAALALLGT